MNKLQAENIVDIGEIRPMDIDLPGIYVDRIVQATVDKKIELLTLRQTEDEGSGNESDSSSGNSSAGSTESSKASAQDRRVRIAKRAAKEVRSPAPVVHMENTMMADALPAQRRILLQLGCRYACHGCQLSTRGHECVATVREWYLGHGSLSYKGTSRCVSSFCSLSSVTLS